MATVESSDGTKNLFQRLRLPNTNIKKQISLEVFGVM